MNPEFQPRPQAGAPDNNPMAPNNQPSADSFGLQTAPQPQSRTEFGHPQQPSAGQQPMFTPSAPQGPQPLPPTITSQPFQNIPNSDMPRPQPLAASQLKKERNILLIPLIVAVVFLLGSLGFGFWAFSERQDYKNNVDSKISEASQAAVKEAVEQKEAEFLEREKRPLKEYKGPQPFGSLSVQYPKTWAAFVTEGGNGKTPVDGYFHPNFVPNVKGGTSFALRVEVIEEAYEEVLSDFDRASDNGSVKISAFQVEKVSGTTGARIDGQITRDKRGSVVLFPLRDKTLRISTQSEDFMKDFNDIILKHLTFAP